MGVGIADITGPAADIGMVSLQPTSYSSINQVKTLSRWDMLNQAKILRASILASSVELSFWPMTRDRESVS